MPVVNIFVRLTYSIGESAVNSPLKVFRSKYRINRMRTPANIYMKYCSTVDNEILPG